MVKDVFLTNGAETTGLPHAKKKEKNLDINCINTTKVSAKWLIHLSVQRKITKSLEENLDFESV